MNDQPFDHIVSEWIGEGQPSLDKLGISSPKPVLQYQIALCPGSTKYWTLRKGKGRGKAYVVEDQDVRFELYFDKAISIDLQEKVILSFQNRWDTAI